MDIEGALNLSTINCLITLTGPSGVGKGTLIKRLLYNHPSIWLSLSATTRIPREGEVNGKDYLFLTNEIFNSKIKAKEFLEWAEFSGNFYGTPREPVELQLSLGNPVLLEIELEGARQIKNTLSHSFQIFIAPPSFQELEFRIRGRKTESEDSINKRLDKARMEIASQKEFDAIIVNTNVENSLYQLEQLIGVK